jgi:hypothetical protein
MRFLLGVGLVLVLLAVAAGCGGGSDDSGDSEAAAEWADSVCTALSDWTAELRQIGEDIAANPSSISRETIEQAASEATAATDALVESLRAAGAPDTESGEEAQQLVGDLATTLEEQLDNAKQAVEGASGVTGILNAIGQVSTAFTAAVDSIPTTVQQLRELDGGELEQAIRNSESCDSLTGS